MIKKLSLALLIALSLIITSCSEPNIYTASGLYSPLDEGAIVHVSSVKAEGGSDFNLYLLTSRSYNTRLTYRVKNSYTVLTQLSEASVNSLIQLLNYVDRVGLKDEFLNARITEDLKEACIGTKRLMHELVRPLCQSALNVAKIMDAVKQGGEEEKNVEDFITRLENYLTVTNEDNITYQEYLSMQLTVDLVSSVLDMLSTLLLDFPSQTLESISQNDFFNQEVFVKIIVANATNLARTLLNAISEIEQVGKHIGYVDVTTIINGLFK